MRMAHLWLIPICVEKRRGSSVGLLALASRNCVDVSLSLAIVGLQDLLASAKEHVLLNYFLSFATVSWVICILCIALQLHVMWQVVPLPTNRITLIRCSFVRSLFNRFATIKIKIVTVLTNCMETYVYVDNAYFNRNFHYNIFSFLKYINGNLISVWLRIDKEDM